MIIINKNKNIFQSAYMYIICINIERGKKRRRNSASKVCSPLCLGWVSHMHQLFDPSRLGAGLAAELGSCYWQPQP